MFIVLKVTHALCNVALFFAIIHPTTISGFFACATYPGVQAYILSFLFERIFYPHCVK